MTLQATETLQNGPFQGIFDEAGAFVGFLNPRANGADLRIGGYAPVSGSFTTLTVSGQASFADGTAAAPSVKIGDEQNGFYSSAANTLDVTCNGVRQAQFAYTAAAVNYLKFTGSGTGSAVWIDARGSDANVSILYSTRGTGAHTFATANSAATQFQINHVANAVNQWQVQGAATGGNPILFATGSDTNVNAVYSLKGAGSHLFYSDSTLAPQFVVGRTASSVNYIQATGAATGAAPSFAVGGSDTNIDLALTPKGTGVLRYGTHSALAAETVTGYITIKDAAGNSRKLAVVS